MKLSGLRRSRSVYQCNELEFIVVALIPDLPTVIRFVEGTNMISVVRLPRIGTARRSTVAVV